MDRVLEHANRVQEWGTPPILDAALAVAVADPVQGTRLASFLCERPPSQIKPGIVPKIGAQSWSSEVFDNWLESKVTGASEERYHTGTKKTTWERLNSGIGPGAGRLFVPPWAADPSTADV